jgi:hypothetical protein
VRKPQKLALWLAPLAPAAGVIKWKKLNFCHNVSQQALKDLSLATTVVLKDKIHRENLFKEGKNESNTFI